MNRRHFLQRIGTSGLLVGTGAFPFSAMANALSAAEMVHLTILHTNDVHSRIDPFPQDGTRNAGMGGVARRAALIKKVRAAEKNVLLLDAGDIFQGTPFFNFYGGELELKLMSEMGYDASTIGNHDFDNGLEGLVKALPNANFPLLNINYDFNDTPMKDKTAPFKIFVKDGVRIGVFGVGIELKGLVADTNCKNTVYLDPLTTANATALRLKKEEKCDYVICLSHLGYEYKNEKSKICDIVFAEQSKHIDLIIGGHTHTFLERPDIRKNADAAPVIINQVGWAGIMLGRIDVYFERTKAAKCNACQNIYIGS